LETTETTDKNNFFFLAAQPRGALETGRGCARMAKVVFISCHGCFLFNEIYPHLHSRAQRRRLSYLKNALSKDDGQTRARHF
jgi:hypothetical protein